MSLFTSDQLAFLEKLDATGTAPKPFPTWTDPKPKNWQPPDDSWANRRKPRMSVTPQMGEIRPDPFPLDFCVWIQSNEFGYNRRYILKSIGATWLGDDAKIDQGVLEWLNLMRQRGERYLKANSECPQKPRLPEVTPCPTEVTP